MPEMSAKQIGNLIKIAVVSWSDDYAPSMGAGVLHAGLDCAAARKN